MIPAMGFVMCLASRSMPPKSRFALQGRRRGWSRRGPLGRALRLTHSCFSVVAVVAAILVGHAAFARPPSAQAGALIDQARKHYHELDFELVVAATDRALALPEANRDQHITALELKGSALVVLGRNHEADTCFWQLFEIDPDHELPPDTSPRVLSVFRPAKARWRVKQQEELALGLGPALGALKLALKLPAKAKGAQPISITADITDPGKIAAELALHYRRTGQQRYATMTTTARVGSNTIQIPGALTAAQKPYSLELFVQLRHQSGVILATSGSATTPHTIAVSAGQPRGTTPVYKHWWFWTAIAVVAASAIAIPIVIDQTRDVGLPTVVGRTTQ